MDELRVIYHMVLELRGAVAILLSYDYTLVEAHVHRTSHAFAIETLPD